MKKILKTIAFLSLAMCLMLNTNVVHAGGKDDTIIDGNKQIIYASHKKLEELVAAEKRQAEGEKLVKDEFFKYFKFVPYIGPIAGGMKAVSDSIEKGLKYFVGDSTFLTNCLQKSKDNGESGCIMKYTYIEHDETPDEYHPDSCEPP